MHTHSQRHATWYSIYLLRCQDQINGANGVPLDLSSLAGAGCHVHPRSLQTAALILMHIPLPLQLSLSMLASDEDRTAILCVLSTLMLGLLTINRMATHPPFMWGIGANSAIGLGITTFTGQHAASHAWVWQMVRCGEGTVLHNTCVVLQAYSVDVSTIDGLPLTMPRPCQLWYVRNSLTRFTRFHHAFPALNMRTHACVSYPFCYNMLQHCVVPKLFNPGDLIPVSLCLQLVGRLLLDLIIGAGVSMLMALTVLPSLAGDELRCKAAAALRGVGQVASRCAVGQQLHRVCSTTGTAFFP